LHASLQCNFQPQSPIQFKTAFGAWIGKVLDLDMLKPFGCEAFAHVPIESHTKQDAPGVKCIYLKCIYLKDKKIVVSIDVTFMENVSKSNLNMILLQVNYYLEVYLRSNLMSLLHKDHYYTKNSESISALS
jgi:hypothetical protein